MQKMVQPVKGYNGNALIKRSNQAIDFTPDMIQEYLKCSQDPVYFTETYMKIINIDDGLVSFKLYALANCFNTSL